MAGWMGSLMDGSVDSYEWMYRQLNGWLMWGQLDIWMYEFLNEFMCVKGSSLRVIIEHGFCSGWVEQFEDGNWFKLNVCDATLTSRNFAGGDLRVAGLQMGCGGCFRWSLEIIKVLPSHLRLNLNRKAPAKSFRTFLPLIENDVKF